MKSFAKSVGDKISSRRLIKKVVESFDQKSRQDV
uniref:Uncharacterized protein n=1 Tax=viral metagenome TaxID=1070528 RepID=A0A6C0CFB1_9ZZZZ